MILNFQIDLNENDQDDLCDIEDKIVQEAAKQLIRETMNNRYEHYGKSFREELHEEVKQMLLDVMDASFKDEVKESVSESLTKKFERTKQYKEIKSAYAIESDDTIKSGMKNLIAELVDSELKKRFK